MSLLVSQMSLFLQFVVLSFCTMACLASTPKLIIFCVYNKILDCNWFVAHLFSMS